MNKRIYGVLGISSIMANWNADFSGFPKTTSNGETYGSDKALKYPMKKMWDNEGKKVLYLKSMYLKKDNTLTPRSLKERYEQLFGVPNLKNCTDASEVLKNLFEAVDVKNFGATFAEEKMNIAITGAVQFGQGFNKFEDTDPQEQNILSPFRDSKKEDAKSSTLGTKIVSDEAHYFYPFVVNPLAYNGFAEMGVTEGYTEEDYLDFKRVALMSATAFATNSKEGCENELAIFVETDPDLYLPNLTQYISFEKEAGTDKKNIIKISCGDFLNEFKDRIKSIEIYYNPYTTEIDTDIEEANYFNIITQKEV